MASPFVKGLLSKIKPPAPSQAASVAAKRVSRIPYASIDPQEVRKDFNVSGFLRGTQVPKKPS